MSLRRLFIPLIAFIPIGGPRSSNLTPIVAEDIAITARAVTIQPDDPSRVRVGSLALVGGWRLESSSRQFGGWSALHVNGDRVVTVSDGGAVLRFRLGRFGHSSEAHIDPLPRGCGPIDDKHLRDSESLAGGNGGDWWVGYEWRNAICRISPDFSRAIRVTAPLAMADWPKRRGPETMLRLADGRFLVLAEGSRGGRPRSLLIFDGDPTDPATKPGRALYRPPVGFDPTDAAQLPDGRILIINRRFGFDTLFTGVLVTVDPARIVAGATIEGTQIARFEPPVLSDNYEGLSVTVEGGKPIVWMISDDNFMAWQGTYLLKFAIDPVEPPTKPSQ